MQQGLSGQRCELNFEPGASAVHEHDRTDVALLEVLARDIGGQHNQVVFSDCHSCTPLNGYAVMNLGLHANSGTSGVSNLNHRIDRRDSSQSRLDHARGIEAQVLAPALGVHLHARRQSVRDTRRQRD